MTRTSSHGTGSGRAGRRDRPARGAHGGPSIRWRPRVARWTLRWILLPVLALYVLYVVLVNVLLFSGGLAWLLHELAPVVRLETGRSFSLWFFRVELRELRLSVMDGSLHLEIEVPRGQVQIRGDRLLSSTFQTSHLEGRELVVRLRPKYDDLDEERRAALPDLPDKYDPLVEEESSPDDLWSHALHGLDIELDEIWISEFRHLGTAHVRGGFAISPMRSLAIDPSDVRLSGELRFGRERTIAAPWDVQARMRVPKTHFDRSPPWEDIEVRARLDAKVTDAGFLRSFFGSPSGPRLERGVLDAELEVTLERDALRGQVRTAWDEAWIHSKSLDTWLAQVVLSGTWSGAASGFPAGTLEDGVADVAVASFQHPDFTIDGWSFRLDLPELRVDAAPTVAQGPFYASADDARPVARMLGIGELPQPLERFLTLPDLGVRGRLFVTGTTQRLDIDRAHSDTIDVRGRWVRVEDASYAAILLTASPLSVGVFTGPDDSGVHLLAGDGWLEEELKKLPPTP